MKKIAAVFLVAFLIVSEAAFADGPFVKLGRGFTNLTTGIGEYIVQTALLAENYNPITALFGGVFKGTAMTLAREVGGVYEIVTFLIPIPRGYRPLWTPATVVDAIQELESEQS